MRIFLTLLIFFITIPKEALAYIGPGAGIGAVGAFIAIVVAVILAILAFVWYPIKRLIAKIRKPKEDKPS